MRKEIGKHTVTMPPESRVSDIKKQLTVDKSLRVVIFVNRKKASDSLKLQDGDFISIVPLFFGG